MKIILAYITKTKEGYCVYRNKRKVGGPFKLLKDKNDVKGAITFATDQGWPYKRLW